MRRLFMPDYCFLSYRDITPDFIREHSLRALLLDIDNTLEPYEHDEPTPELLDWLSMLKEQGVKVAFISNNKRERVEHFNEKLGYTAYWYSCKPFKRNIIKALKALDENRENALFMGDQIWTDVWGAHNARLSCIIVPPIRDKQNFITKLKRFLERPILRRYRKEHPESYECEVWTRWKL